MTKKKKLAKLQNQLRPAPRRRDLIGVGAGFFAIGFLTAGVVGAVLEAKKLQALVQEARARFVNAHEDAH